MCDRGYRFQIQGTGIHLFPGAFYARDVRIRSFVQHRIKSGFVYRFTDSVSIVAVGFCMKGSGVRPPGVLADSARITAKQFQHALLKMFLRNLDGFQKIVISIFK